MKKLHYGQCLIGVAIAAALLLLFGVQASTLGVLAVFLLCPLMMFVMMRMMMGDQHGSSDHHHDNKAVVHSDKQVDHRSYR